MNIICNNCIGSHAYYKLGERLPNPFQWCGIDLIDFVYIGKHWGKMNLSDVSFEFETRLYQTRETVLCNIDGGRAKVHFSHYIQDWSFDEPGRSETWKYCILYKDILGWTRKKWFSRMGRSEEPVTFVYCFNLWDMRHPKTRKEYPVALKMLFEIKEPLLILMHESVDVPGDMEVPENVTIVKVPDGEMSFCTPYLVDRILDYFKNKTPGE